MEKSISQQLVEKATNAGKMPIPYLKPAIRKENANGKMSVVGTGKHTVKLIGQKSIMGTDYKTKVKRAEVEYLFEEDGQKKRYSVPVMNENDELHYLIQRMSEVQENETITLEYKRNGMTGFISIERNNGGIDDGEIPTGEIPIIEEDEEPEVKKVVPMKGGKPKDAEDVFGDHVPGTDTNEEIDVNNIPF